MLFNQKVQFVIFFFSFMKNIVYENITFLVNQLIYSKNMQKTGQFLIKSYEHSHSMRNKSQQVDFFIKK